MCKMQQGDVRVSWCDRRHARSRCVTIIGHRLSYVSFVCTHCRASWVGRVEADARGSNPAHIVCWRAAGTTRRKWRRWKRRISWCTCYSRYTCAGMCCVYLYVCVCKREKESDSERERAMDNVSVHVYMCTNVSLCLSVPSCLSERSRNFLKPSWILSFVTHEPWLFSPPLMPKWSVEMKSHPELEGDEVKVLEIMGHKVQLKVVLGCCGTHQMWNMLRSTFKYCAYISDNRRSKFSADPKSKHLHKPVINDQQKVKVQQLDSKQILCVPQCHLYYGIGAGARWDGLHHPNISRLIRFFYWLVLVM